MVAQEAKGGNNMRWGGPESNLDRFAQGPEDPQDTTPEEEIFAECAICNRTIYYGDDYIDIDDGDIIVCDDLDCLLEAINGEWKVAGE